jgi:hypothetical protein
MSFSALERIFPNLFKKCSRSELVCDVCKFAKHTRTTYPSLGSRSLKCFDIIHFDFLGPSHVVSSFGFPSLGSRSLKCFDIIHFDFLGPSHVVSSFGFRWFVTFIDCCSRVTGCS